MPAPSIPPSGGKSYFKALGQQHTQVSKTDADANEFTAYTLVIPANTMGPNDTLVVRTLASYPNSATTKTVKIRIGATAWKSMQYSTTQSGWYESRLSNRNATNAQISDFSGAVGFTSSSSPTTFAFDFTTAQTLTVTLQWGTAGSGSNSMALESVMVEIIRGGP